MDRVRSNSIGALTGLALVLCAHALALQWLLSVRPALRDPLVPRPIEVRLVQAEHPRPPQPVIEPPKPKLVAPIPPKPVVRKIVPRAPVTPPPVLVAEPAPTQPSVAEAPPAPPEPVRIEGPPEPAPVAVVAAPAAVPSPSPEPPAPEPVIPPLFNADYLANPAPPYPNQSRRMGEEGKVLLRVLVDTRGLPQRVELRKTSGFDRLDDVAIATVKHWKFVPARQGEKTISAWVLIPINFNLREGN